MYVWEIKEAITCDLDAVSFIFLQPVNRVEAVYYVVHTAKNSFETTQRLLVLFVSSSLQ